MRSGTSPGFAVLRPTTTMGAATAARRDATELLDTHVHQLARRIVLVPNSIQFGCLLASDVLRTGVNGASGIKL